MAEGNGPPVVNTDDRNVPEPEYPLETIAYPDWGEALRIDNAIWSDGNWDDIETGLLHLRSLIRLTESPQGTSSNPGQGGPLQMINSQREADQGDDQHGEKKTEVIVDVDEFGNHNLKFLKSSITICKNNHKNMFAGLCISDCEWHMRIHRPLFRTQWSHGKPPPRHPPGKAVVRLPKATKTKGE